MFAAGIYDINGFGTILSMTGNFIFIGKIRKLVDFKTISNSVMERDWTTVCQCINFCFDPT